MMSERAGGQLKWEEKRRRKRINAITDSQNERYKKKRVVRDKNTKWWVRRVSRKGGGKRTKID